MKIGVVGNGMIAEMFLKDAQSMEHAAVVSLCVRKQSLEKGQKLADAYRIPRVETDYEAFLSDPEIETVYLGISNSAHFDYAKKALEAGKHVICEKPFTVTGAQARELAALAQQKQLFLWEAFIIPYAPAWPSVKESVSRVGSIKLVQCNYSQFSSRYKRYMDGIILPAFDPALSGGALYDLNIYNLHFTVGLFGKPKSARYYPNYGHNGIDTSGIAVLSYDGFHAVCCGAKDSSSPCGFLIQGDRGTVRGEGPVSVLSKVTFREGKEEEETLATGNGVPTLADELREFIRQYETADFGSCYRMLEHSVDVAETVDMLHSVS